MKKALLTLSFFAMAFCTYAASVINTIKISNNSGCNLYVKGFADAATFCTSLYETDWLFVPAGSPQIITPTSPVWITSPASILYNIWWSQIRVSNDPRCPMGTGSPGCIAGDQITLDACLTSLPSIGCFTITNSCNTCPPNTKVDVRIMIVGSVMYLEMN